MSDSMRAALVGLVLQVPGAIRLVIQPGLFGLFEASASPAPVDFVLRLLLA